MPTMPATNSIFSLAAKAGAASIVESPKASVRCFRPVFIALLPLSCRFPGKATGRTAAWASPSTEPFAPPLVDEDRGDQDRPDGDELVEGRHAEDDETGPEDHRD